MSQRAVQLVIGRLVTDSAFRRRVERGGSAYLAGLRAQGIDLNRTEIAALIGVDPRFWASIAKRIDPGLSRHQASPDDDGPPVPPPLTAQQQRVLAAICDGSSNKDIASQLGISESAVKATVQELFRKLSVRRRVHLVRLALEHPEYQGRPRAAGRGSAPTETGGGNGEGVAHAS